MKKDEKAIYRRPSYIPPKKRIKPDKRNKHNLESLSELLKHNGLYAFKGYLQLLYEIGQKGANIDLISHCIGEGIHDPSTYNRLVTKVKNKAKSISGRFNQTIKIPLLKVQEHTPDELAKTVDRFNKILKKKQDELDELKEMYLSLLELVEAQKAPFAWRPMGLIPFMGLKKISIKEMGISKQINKKIVPIVDELIRIGYSNKRAYTITGKLLNLSYPNRWKDDDPDLIRQRYTALKKKNAP